MKPQASKFWPLISIHLIGFAFVVASLAINPLRLTRAFFSDEAVYYTMAHSFVEDRDMEFQRGDLIRVYKEFSAGPTGIILKINERDNTIVFGKGFLYSLAAAPLVYLLKTNGFFLLNAILLWINLLCAYRFCRALMEPSTAALVSLFYFVANASLLYLFWMTPEYFNMSLVCLACFFFVSAEVLKSERLFFRAPYNYVLSALFFALATYGKPTNALLIIPLGIWMLTKRKVSAALLTLAIFILATVAMFGINVYFTGDWNYQGGHRAAFYNRFPFENPGVSEFAPFSRKEPIVAMVRPPFYWKAFLNNWIYFFFGRYSGLAIYFFPMFFALSLFPFLRKKTSVALAMYAAGWIGIFTYMIGLPWNYFGGSGTIGNRYLLNAFPIFLFGLTSQPPRKVLAIGICVSMLFTAAFLYTPIFSSFRNSFHQQASVFKLLPAEKSLLGDLPTNANAKASRVYFDNPSNHFIYFLDDNTYYKDAYETVSGFWVKGERTAEFIIRAFQRSTKVKVLCATRVIPNEVTVSIEGGQTKVIRLESKDFSGVEIQLPEPFPYDRDNTGATYLYRMRIKAASGAIVPEAPDEERYLGVFVRLEIQ